MRFLSRKSPVIAVIASLAGASPSLAQSPTIDLASITTDTGDFVVGRTSLSHYNTIQLCMAAAENAGRMARLAYVEQATAARLRPIPLRDTLPTVQVTLARECVAKFSAQSTTDRDVPDLVTLALMAGRDTLASAAIDRWISFGTTPVARDSITAKAIDSYLMAHPARPVAAEALSGRVAQTGPAGTLRRMYASEQMVRFWERVFDHQKVREWAERVLTLFDSLPSDRRTGNVKYSMYMAFDAIAKVGYAESPDSLHAVALRALPEFHKLRNDTIAPFSFDPQTVGLDAIERALSPIPAVYAHRGDAYPRLQADYWFPAAPPPHDTSITLYVSTMANWAAQLSMFDGAACLVTDISLIYDGADNCSPLWERLRDIVAQYGSHGLRVVVIAGTQGMAARSLPLSPAKEAERLNWYLRDYLKLPVTLAVVTRTPIKLPAPDGRQFRKAVCSQFYPAGSVMNDSSEVACKYLDLPLVLLGRHGEVVYAGGNDPLFDTLLDQAASGRTVSAGIPVGDSK